MKTGTTNMTTGSVKRVMLVFALPVLFSQLFQQLYNAADSLIVGNLLGKQALAAVSSSSALLALLTELVIGVSLGAGIVISRYFGAEKHETVSDAIHTTVAFGLTAGVLMTVVGTLLSPVLLRWMGTAPDVIEGSISYFRNYFLGSLGVLLYNVFTGIMTALGDSRRPLFYLVFSSVLNVILDIVFIAGLGFGVGSAATATAISQSVSALLCFVYLRRPDTIFQVRVRDIRFHPHLMREIVRMGLPTGIQNSVISIGNVTVQTYINSFGSGAMAGCGIYNKLWGFAVQPVLSFATALATFISQNIGAKQFERAKQGARFGLFFMVMMAELIGLVLMFGAPVLARLFNSDSEVVRIVVAQSRVENIFFFLMGFSHSIAAVCRGAGRATVPMMVMPLTWCVLRIIFIAISMNFVHDIRILFWAYPISWVISSAIFLTYYLKSDWVHALERNAGRALPH